MSGKKKDNRNAKINIQNYKNTYGYKWKVQMEEAMILRRHSKQSRLGKAKTSMWYSPSSKCEEAQIGCLGMHDKKWRKRPWK